MTILKKITWLLIALLSIACQKTKDDYLTNGNWDKLYEELTNNKETAFEWKYVKIKAAELTNRLNEEEVLNFSLTEEDRQLCDKWLKTKLATDTGNIFLKYLLFSLQTGSNFADNLRNATALINKDENYAPSYFLRGIILYNKHLYDKAIQNFELALKLDSNLFEARNYIIQCFMRMKFFDKAEEAARTALAIMPNCAKTNYLLATALRMRNNKSSEEFLIKALQIAPYYTDIQKEMTFKHLKTEDYEVALAHCTEWVKKEPKSLLALDLQGFLFAQTGNLEQSASALQQVLEIDSNYTSSILNLAYDFVFMKNFKAANEMFSNLLKQKKDALTSNYNLNIALVEIYRGKFATALKTLDNGTKTDEANKYYGVLRANKDIAKAFVYEYKNDLQAALKFIEAGMTNYQQANKRSPVYWRHYYVRLLARTGKFDKAEKIAENLRTDIEKHPTEKHYYFIAAAFIESEKKNHQKAIELFKEAQKTTNTFYLNYLLAEQYDKIGNQKQAIETYETAMKQYGERRLFFGTWGALIYYNLGNLYLKNQQPDLAKNNFEQFLAIWSEADASNFEFNDAKQKIEKLKK